MHGKGTEPFVSVLRAVVLGKWVLLHTCNLWASNPVPSGDRTAAEQPSWIVGTLAKRHSQLAFANTALLYTPSNSR